MKKPKDIVHRLSKIGKVSEERKELLEWVWDKMDPNRTPPTDVMNNKDRDAFNALMTILELSPAILTYHLKRFHSETEEILDSAPFTPMYVDTGSGLVAIEGFRLASLDGGGFGPEEEAIVLEVGPG
jgi:hypothetical protein